MKTLIKESIIEKNYFAEVREINSKYLSEEEKARGLTFKPLSRAEEIALFVLFRQGNQAAGQEIIERNLLFVAKIVKQYSSRTNYFDLIQSGNLGLIEARDKFDPTLGVRFISFARWEIVAKMFEHFAKFDLPIRFPLSVLARVRKSEYKISIVYLDQYLDDDSGFHGSLSAFSEEIEKFLFQREFSQGVEKVLPSLDDFERKILDEYFGLSSREGKFFSQIGQDVGLSRERLRQIKDLALDKIKKRLKFIEIVGRQE